MGRMWKYEPEDEDKNHLRGQQFKYQPAVTRGYEFDNDGNPIFPEKRKETKAEYGKRTAMNARALKNEHEF